MSENRSHTEGASIARTFSRTVADLSQYLSVQKELGNTHIRVTDQTLATIAAWGDPSWRGRRFLAQGPEDAGIVIVDSRGSFYEGPAGGLLVKILAAMRLTPAQVFICNTADPDRILSHIGRHRIKAVIALGEKAGCILLGRKDRLERFRGRFHPVYNTRFMASHHPEALLENPGLKRQVWDDMQVVMKHAGL